MFVTEPLPEHHIYVMICHVNEGAVTFSKAGRRRYSDNDELLCTALEELTRLSKAYKAWHHNHDVLEFVFPLGEKPQDQSENIGW